MGKRFTQFLALAVCLFFATGLALAQVSTVGRLIGTVTDPTGAVVSGADVKAVDEATGKAFETKTSGDGGFVFGNLQPGSYTITVTMQGFKKAEYRAVKIVVGGQYALTVQLVLGEVASTVVIEAGAEVLQTSETKVGTTIMGKAITQLPFTSRDTLDLAILMPGAQTVGRPRATSFMGLPKGSINITLDGISDTDQFYKSSDGFFTMVRPRVDTIEEFSISTAAGSAAETGEGAVQIRFETKRGSNEFHGGAWWYHRNDKFNSQYFFNNEVAPGQKAITKQRQRLNQFGVKVGGPIIKDKLFFFTALDFYRNPQSLTRSRTILTDEATAGLYRYSVGSSAVSVTTPLGTWMNCGTGIGPGFTGTIPANTQCLINVMNFGGSFGFPASFDSLVSSYLTAINTSVSVPGVSLLFPQNLYTRSISFTNGGGGRRNFPDFRFDYNLTKNHTITAIYHYNYFGGKPDFLNGFDATYPVEPFKSNIAGQYSNRNQTTAAWRWNIGSNKSNEVRIGLNSSPTVWAPDYNLSLYPQFTAQLATGGTRTVRVNPSFNFISQPLPYPSASGRNPAIMQLIETFSWSRGKHNFTFGGNWTEVMQKTYDDPDVGGVGLGIVATDDPFDAFPTTTRIPGASSTDIGNVKSLYAMLTGRVSGWSSSANLNQATRQFDPSSRALSNVRQTEIGVYGSDNWRLFSTLTLNLGLRWEYQGAFRDTFNQYYRAQGDLAGLAGYSCSLNNLFTPTTTGCATTEFVLNNGREWWQKDLNNFGPSAGVAWTPNFGGSLAKWILGGPGKSVFRAGYAISFSREGNYNFYSIAGGNPGYYSSTYTDGSSFVGDGYFTPGTVTIQNGVLPNVAVDPPTFGGSFTSTAASGFGVNVYDQHLQIPYVQSWSVGWQREVTPSTVVEVRYVGNHGTGLWRQFALNEQNIFQPSRTINGVAVPSFLTEFTNAQNNIAICRANSAACIAAQAAAGVSAANQTVNNFANWGLAGQSPLPIFTSAFSSTLLSPATVAAGSAQQAGSSFRSGTWVNTGTATTRGGYLFNGAAGTAASSLNSLTGWSRMVASGFPSNFWMFNPDTRGNVYLMGNFTHSNYNGLQIEVRRKPMKGLQFNGSYTFSKSLSNYYGDDLGNYGGFTSIRNPRRDRSPSPWDLRHQFKLQLIYELPFGPGRKFSSSMGWLNRVIEGWELNTITRWQSGRTFRLDGGSGTGVFNSSDGGVQLIGLTPKQVQDMLSVRKTANGQVYFFPESLINSTTGTADYTKMQPCRTTGVFCQRLFLHGPTFFRPDWSIAKRTKISEKVNIEYRAEFLNAFNNANFFFGGAANVTTGSTNLQAPNFGRITSAYQDTSTTDDNGGRIIQMVLRINF